MKKVSLLIFLITSSFSICFSQDIISQKNGEDLKAKVLEVNTSEVKYKKHENVDGPTYTILKSEVLSIQYENGSKDIFSEHATLTDKELYAQGRTDASKYYKKYRAAGTGTLLTGLVISPLAGLVPAIITSSTPPKETNLNFPNPDQIKIPAYYDGYTEKAKKIKKVKVWTNWGISMGVSITLATILILSGEY